MTPIRLRRALASAALAATLCPLAQAGPGAHGPNGEHLDGPPATPAPHGSLPRLEASTEQFELVATLGGGELSMLIDRFATNEPLLNAQVEVESGGLKARAPFHDDIGDYAVADAALLKLLGTPGEHPLVITVIHGNESDLLAATLKVAPADAAPTPALAPARLLPLLGVAAGAGLLAAVLAWRRRAGASAWNGGQA